jgi:chitin synthase
MLFVLQKEKENEKKLKDLRDVSVFAFFMLNALFVLVIFLLQLSQDQLHINWPFGVKSNITFDNDKHEVRTLCEH